MAAALLCIWPNLPSAVVTDLVEAVWDLEEKTGSWDPRSQKNIPGKTWKNTQNLEIYSEGQVFENMKMSEKFPKKWEKYFENSEKYQWEEDKESMKIFKSQKIFQKSGKILVRPIKRKKVLTSFWWENLKNYSKFWRIFNSRKKKQENTRKTIKLGKKSLKKIPRKILVKPKKEKKKRSSLQFSWTIRKILNIRRKLGKILRKKRIPEAKSLFWTLTWR